MRTEGSQKLTGSERGPSKCESQRGCRRGMEGGAPWGGSPKQHPPSPARRAQVEKQEERFGKHTESAELRLTRRFGKHTESLTLRQKTPPGSEEPRGVLSRVESDNSNSQHFPTSARHRYWRCSRGGRSGRASRS